MLGYKQSVMEKQKGKLESSPWPGQSSPGRREEQIGGTQACSPVAPQGGGLTPDRWVCLVMHLWLLRQRPGVTWHGGWNHLEACSLTWLAVAAGRGWGPQLDCLLETPLTPMSSSVAPCASS